MLNMLIGPVSSLVSDVIKRVLPPEKMSEAERADVETQMQQALIKMDWSVIEKQASVIIAEAQGGNWLQRSWRPITMLVFVYIIAHNYIFAPILKMFVPEIPILEIPPGMWDLLKLGLGGYVVGRSGEKMVKAYKGK